MTAEPLGLKARVRARVLAGDDAPAAVDRSTLAALVAADAPLLSADRRDAVVQELLADLRGLGPLEPLLADPTVTDVLVNGPGPVWVERNGTLQKEEVCLDAVAIEALVERIVAPLGLRADRSSPLAAARLADGSRVQVVLPPLAVDGPCLAIRRFAARALPLTAFAPPALARWLEAAVRGRRSIVVSGGTGAGKTTLCNALAAHIPAGERIVTVEDAAELRLPHPHVVRLEARPANADGAGEVTVRDLVRAALRLRPDRIIVGECRGAEAFDMVQAMSTGHAGSLSTCHANDPADALRRLETMALLAGTGLPHAAVRAQVAAAVDVLVQVRRSSAGGRRIDGVAEVVPDLSHGTRLRPVDPEVG